MCVLWSQESNESSWYTNLTSLSYAPKSKIIICRISTHQNTHIAWYEKVYLRHFTIFMVKQMKNNVSYSLPDCTKHAKPHTRHSYATLLTTLDTANCTPQLSPHIACHSAQSASRTPYTTHHTPHNIHHISQTNCDNVILCMPQNAHHIPHLARRIPHTTQYNKIQDNRIHYNIIWYTTYHRPRATMSYMYFVYRKPHTTFRTLHTIITLYTKRCTLHATPRKSRAARRTPCQIYFLIQTK